LIFISEILHQISVGIHIKFFTLHHMYEITLLGTNCYNNKKKSGAKTQIPRVHTSSQITTKHKSDASTINVCLEKGKRKRKERNRTGFFCYASAPQEKLLQMESMCMAVMFLVKALNQL